VRRDEALAVVAVLWRTLEDDPPERSPHLTRRLERERKEDR
jgi:hypothetical protein